MARRVEKEGKLVGFNYTVTLTLDQHISVIRKAAELNKAENDVIAEALQTALTAPAPAPVTTK